MSMLVTVMIAGAIQHIATCLRTLRMWELHEYMNLYKFRTLFSTGVGDRWSLPTMMKVLSSDIIHVQF